VDSKAFSLFAHRLPAELMRRTCHRIIGIMLLSCSIMKFKRTTMINTRFTLNCRERNKLISIFNWWVGDYFYF